VPASGELRGPRNSRREFSPIVAEPDKLPACGPGRLLSSSGCGASSRPARDLPEALISQQPPDDESQPPRSRALIGLIVVALLVVAAVYLVHALREESQREDCLMSGRSNCAPIDVPGAK
jgi:hypothetical protein